MLHISCATIDTALLLYYILLCGQLFYIIRRNRVCASACRLVFRDIGLSTNSTTFRSKGLQITWYIVIVLSITLKYICWRCIVGRLAGLATLARSSYVAPTNVSLAFCF